VGEGVSSFSKGQRVLAHALGLVTNKSEHSGFQLYSIALVAGTCPVPDGVSFEEACVLPLAVSTAAHGLSPRIFWICRSRDTTSPQLGRTILDWSEASSVGCVANQLAVAAGLKVITTASSHTLNFAKQIGASEVFDYNSASVVGDLTAALDEHDRVGAYDGKDTTPPALLSFYSLVPTYRFHFADLIGMCCQKLRPETHK
jgi:NADPH:quinone reductase-like Zn-dependent oxidoreductase